MSVRANKKASSAPQPQRRDSADADRLDRFERRIALVHHAGEAALIWARVVLVLMVPIAVVAGLPLEAIALAREAIGSP